MVTSQGFNWRVAFWIGAGIAMIGVLARTALRETPEFADAKRQIKYILEKNKLDGSLKTNTLVQERVNIRTALANFLHYVDGQYVVIFLIPITIINTVYLSNLYT